MVKATTQPEMFNDNPLEVELRAILWGMQLCLPMGARNVVVETDCLVAVQAFDVGPNSFACYHHLLYEILSLKDCFEECKFSYVCRVGDSVAHLLARHARNVESITVWLGLSPRVCIIGPLARCQL